MNIDAAIIEQSKRQDNPNHVDIYVDGSYNSKTEEYGYGVYIDDGKQQQIYYGHGICVEGGRNVEGEVAAARIAIEYFKSNPHYKSLTIYYDYNGIGFWPDKKWRANKAYTIEYAQFVNQIRNNNNLQIDFQHVNGHTGVKGNEYVDKIAKVACGIKLTQKEKEFLSQLSDVPGFPNDYEINNDLEYILE